MFESCEAHNFYHNVVDFPAGLQSQSAMSQSVVGAQPPSKVTSSQLSVTSSQLSVTSSRLSVTISQDVTKQTTKTGTPKKHPVGFQFFPLDNCRFQYRKRGDGWRACGVMLIGVEKCFPGDMVGVITTGEITGVAMSDRSLFRAASVSLCSIRV